MDEEGLSLLHGIILLAVEFQPWRGNDEPLTKASKPLHMGSTTFGGFFLPGYPPSHFF